MAEPIRHRVEAGKGGLRPGDLEQGHSMADQRPHRRRDGKKAAIMQRLSLISEANAS